MKTRAQRLGITEFPYSEFDSNANTIYFETSKGSWIKREFDYNNYVIYYEDSEGGIYGKRSSRVLKNGTELFVGERYTDFPDKPGYWFDVCSLDDEVFRYINSDGAISFVKYLDNHVSTNTIKYVDDDNYRVFHESVLSVEFNPTDDELSEMKEVMLKSKLASEQAKVRYPDDSMFRSVWMEAIRWYQSEIK